MKRLTQMSVMTVLLLVLSCDNNNTNKKELSNVGVVAPLTGEGATYGQSMKRGLDLAFRDNPSFKLIYEDSNLDAKQGITALQKLISADKVKVVFGAAASSVTLAMAPVAEKNKTILFSSISTADEIKESGDYIFRNVPKNAVQGKTAAEFLFKKLGVINVAIFNENDDYGINLANSFKKRFTELGGKIVFEDAYSAVSNNFRTALSKIRSSGADAVFAPGNYQETSIILKQSKELNLETVFVAGDGSYSPELLKIAGNSAEGFYCTIMAVDKENNYYKEFESAFINKYNQEPDVYDAYAYEAGTILLEALEKVGNDADKIKQYLYTSEFESLTGALKFDTNGEVERNYGIVKVENSNFITVKIH